MAVEVFSGGSSPRISFSYDLSQSDVVSVRTSSSSSSTTADDFDFCVLRDSFDLESSSSDELFSDGKILPVEIKRRISPPRRPAAPPVLPRTHAPPPNSIPIVAHPKKLPGSEEKRKSIWRFSRSSSLNCGGGGGTLFPFPLLSRSKSAGSSPSPSIANDLKQNAHRSIPSNTWQKQSPAYSGRPPLTRNNSYGCYGNSRVKLNRPVVLNVPPANLFGLGSIFSVGKDKSKKKH